MNKSLQIKTKFTILFFVMISSLSYSFIDVAPEITVEGNQAFCIGSPINIVTDFTITDEDNTGISFFFIQISAGYQVNFDRLELTGTHPTIIPLWDEKEGKLTFIASVSGSEILLSDLENAVKDVVFKTTALNLIPKKTFSLTIDDANYLPSTDHFYQFVDQQSISWSDAKVAAESRTYYGREGYLATLTTKEEADFAGKQASGAGWIGGSDEEIEGEWKWVTGPETGTVFWRGQVNGTSPNFAFWNNNEPNNSGNEDYAHMTDPSIGISGAWNDLPNEGGTDLYIPKGYIVEYGKPGDPVLKIAASTSIYVPEITSTTNATLCESGIVTISASATEGEILWFDTLIGGNSFFTGTDFTTPNLNISTTYYAAVSLNGCTTLNRTPVLVTVTQRPIITDTKGDLICSGTANLSASASSANVYWYDSLTSSIPIFIGNDFQTPVLNSTKSYYVEANNSRDCNSNSRIEVIAVVDDTIPKFDLLQDTLVLCEDIGFTILETTNSEGNYRYVWKKDGELLAGDLESLSINSSGNYSVSAISEAGCESIEQNIIVVDSDKATITEEDVIITDDSENNSIQVANFNLGNGDYEFAIDDEFDTYKDIGFFPKLSTGLHTLFVRDKGGCGTEKFIFSILAYPKFFTPNEDGQNDFWIIAGFDKTFYSASEIFIYNRYGKLLFKFDINSEGWDGNFEGKRAISGDYWFKATLTDIKGTLIEKIGNFSLIRK